MTDQKTLEKVFHRLNTDLGIVQVQGGGLILRDD